ncbi:MAG: cell division protein ZapA [Bacteroidia bacterium]
MSDVSIHVEIAGSIYPVKVSTDEEKGLKEVVNIINDKIGEFEGKYGIKDKKDVLAMVTLQMVTELYKELNSSTEELGRLKSLLSNVDEMLRQHQSNIRSIEE